MKISLKILLIPLILIILFFANAFTPVEVLGCYTRGMVAFIVASVSGIAAIITTVIALKKRLVKDPSCNQWILITLMLCIPLVALLYLA